MVEWVASGGVAGGVEVSPGFVGKLVARDEDDIVAGDVCVEVEAGGLALGAEDVHDPASDVGRERGGLQGAVIGGVLDQGAVQADDGVVEGHVAHHGQGGSVAASGGEENEPSGVSEAAEGAADLRGDLSGVVEDGAVEIGNEHAVGAGVGVGGLRLPHRV